jgi:hypothetical protein
MEWLKNKKEEMTQKVGDTVKSGMNSFDNFKEKSSGLIDTALNEINGLKPVLKSSGFIVGDIFFTVSIPPSVGLIVEQEIDGAKKIENLGNNEELSKTQQTVLNSLKKIYSMNDVVEKHDHTIGQVEITLGLPPTVKAHLNAKKSRAFT